MLHRKAVLESVSLAKGDIEAPNIFDRLLVTIKTMLHPGPWNPITGRAGF
jgi:hypothetical protein